MSKIVYKEMRFSADSLVLIEKVNQIIKEYHWANIITEYT